jgi:putative drug exporter of the RND superfamily
MLTLLPAVLVIFGRRLFWPFVPSFGSTVREDAGVWARVGRWVGRRPRPVWLGTTAILAVLALGLLTLDTNLRQEDQFPGEPDAVAGQRLIEASYPSGTGQQTTVIAVAGQAEQVLAVLPFVPLIEIGIVVAFGVLLDTWSSARSWCPP